MNKVAKSLLALTAGLLALCLCLGAAGLLAAGGFGWLVDRSVDSDPQTVATTGDKIASYTVPAGFDQGHALALGDLAMVTYTGADGHSHIYLIQAPPSLAPDREELERQAEQAAGTDAWAETTVVERRPCTIRDQETTLVISEGLNHDGARYRSASALFEGNGGPALVNVSGPVAGWDEQLVDAFLASLH